MITNLTKRAFLSRMGLVLLGATIIGIPALRKQTSVKETGKDGVEIHPLTVGEMPSHTHSLTVGEMPSHTHPELFHSTDIYKWQSESVL